MIKFSTKKLLIADSSKSTQLFKRYMDGICNRNFHTSKDAFRETLKVNFREELVRGKVDNSPSSPKSIAESIEDMRGNVSRAQKIINFKNDRVGFGRVRLIQYLNRRK